MKNIRILLIDDEEGFSSVLAKRLTRRGVEVITAADGAEGLLKLDTELFQVVVLDMKMPGMNGLQVLKTIKNRHPSVEVILLTGNADMDSALASMNAGAFDFMLKPANTEILTHRIYDAAKNSRVCMDRAG
ncbi:response regulator [Desulfovibrio sp. JC010]|uniref:response regulator n=1 Tax=Desulfovibrio sp. JC010 TaxID=2593641 RepID=UPI0013D056F2|nr:response regulator [Desulfovibrio sp. JC010]NDV27825.1 response regulator [Desulfovibrio sp. JC010]